MCGSMCLETQTDVTVSFQCGMEDGEAQKVQRRVQMYIDEDPGNPLSNKSKTILI